MPKFLHISTACLCSQSNSQFLNMDGNSSARFQEAMDSLWFSKNILLFEPDGLSLGSHIKTVSSSSQIPISQLSSAKSNPENKRSQLITEEKRTPRLDIVISQPLFQLQTPNRRKLRSHISFPSVSTGPDATNRRRLREQMRNCKSTSELENYELKGFMDLGFVFQKKELNQQIIGILPGLQRLGKNGAGSEVNREEDEKRVRRPYLSEAWLVNRSSTSLFNVWMLPTSPEGDEMKKSLRFWARNVASLLQKNHQ